MQRYILATIFLLMTSLGWSQMDQEKLERRKAQLQEEIRAKQELLKSQNIKQKSVTTIIVQQTEKIKLREKLINTTEKQERLLKDNMYRNQLDINHLNADLEVLKADYAEMIVKSYKSRSEQSRAMFLLSSENFLQAYKRAQYMKQYAAYRKAQGEEIKAKTEHLATLNNNLQVQKKEKQALIVEKEHEKKELEQDKQEKEKLVESIKQDKKKIAAEIKKKQQESRAIDRQINKLIREAIAEANRKAAEANRKALAEASRKAAEKAAEAKRSGKALTAAEKKTIDSTIKASENSAREIESSTKIILTPEAKIVSDNFKANRGRLPWPVEKGTVYLGYGDQPHPMYKTLTVHNSGVDIATEEGSNARAVFGGIVTKVIALSPVNKAVFIQHGDYFTVYQNLSSVNVSKGDKVNTKQTLGRIRTNGDTGKTIIKFMILQNTTANNPASWLFNM